MNIIREEIAFACNIGGIFLNAAAIGVALYVAHEATKDQKDLAEKQAVLLTQQKDILADLKSAQEEIANKQAYLLKEQEKRLQEMENISKQSILNERKTVTIRAYTDLFEDVLTWFEYKGGSSTVIEEILGYMDEAAKKSNPGSGFFYNPNSLQGMKEYVNKIQRIYVFAAGITSKEGIEPLYDLDTFKAIGGDKYFKDRIIDRLKAFYDVCKLYNERIDEIYDDKLKNAPQEQIDKLKAYQNRRRISLSNLEDTAFLNLIEKCDPRAAFLTINKGKKSIKKIKEELENLFPAP